MKKIIAILVSLIMLLTAFVACSKQVEVEAISTTQPASIEQIDEFETSNTTSYYVEETTEQTYYHSALEGCVIVEQDGSDHVIYQEKCEMCGTLQSGTHSVYRSMGTLNSSFMCQNCRNTQTVQLHSEMQ